MAEKATDGTVSSETVEEEPEKTVSQVHVNEFSTKKECDDLVLRVEGKPLYVSKTLLSFISPVLKEMFNDTSNHLVDGEVKMTGQKYEDIVEFLQCVYPNILKPVTLKNVYIVSAYAHEYKVEMLKSSCELCLLKHVSRRRELNVLYNVLEKACLYDFKEVQKKCIDIISQGSHQQYMEAERSFVFSDEVGNQIRKKMLQDLQLKYPDVFGQVQTSRALCRYLGSVAQKKGLMKSFFDGRVFGEFATLSVSYSTWTKTKVEISVDGIDFNTHLEKEFYNNQWGYTSQIYCKSEDRLPFDSICAAIMVNHTSWDDKVYTKQHQFDKSKQRCTMVLEGVDVCTFQNKDFSRCGEVELQVYIFKISK